MIGIIVPAHNEEDLVKDCIAHLLACRDDPRLQAEEVQVVVVADACSDATARLAAAAGARVLVSKAGNVGAARAAGAALMLEAGARWLAFTDADTLVSPGWLAEQLACDADVVCGTVAVVDWTPHGEHAEMLECHFAQTYRDVEDHRHIHGANLGVCAQAYRRAGGFRPLPCSEDVDLIDALTRTGATICWSARPRVATSARRLARASGGFADALLQAVAQRLQVLNPAMA